MGKARVGWRPEILRARRQAHGLTLEAAGEKLREAAQRAGLTVPAANFQTLWQHEQGEVYPGPHYRRGYCLLYRASEPELGFRHELPGEQARPELTAPAELGGDARTSAMERLLLGILPTAQDTDEQPLGQHILQAWRHRQDGQRADGPTLLLVGGHAGSGKSEFARLISQLSGWPVLDKDPLTRPLAERLLLTLGGSPDDRHTELYRQQVRPLEYQCLMEAAYANVDCGISMVLAAPFVAELTDPRWVQRLRNRCEARGTRFFPVWIRCDLETMHEHISFRSAARDSWKLQNWDEYAATIDPDLRPSVPHLLIDNRLGAAMAVADQVVRMSQTEPR